MKLRNALATCFLLLASAACGPGASPDDVRALSQAALGVSTLRLMAGNLTSGNAQSYDPGEGARLFQAMRPDVAMLQEFNVRTNSSADLRAFVDQAFGPGFTYVRGAPAQIPNGIVSRYPILESGDWADALVGNRAFTWARIDVPGPTDLWAVSVHLLTRSSGARDQEAQALAALIAQRVPAGDFVVIGGDFNTSTRVEPALGSLSSTVVTTGPWPTDAAGDGDTNAGRTKPYDWVLVSPALSARAVPTVVGQGSFPSGYVVDTRTWTTPESPALLTDPGAVNMQHMGVVRDFVLGDEPARVIVNEVLANEPGTTTAAEFVELHNAGGTAADLSGWTLSDAAAVRHVFAAGTTLPPGQTLGVFGAASGFPAGLVNAVASSTGTLSLNNGGDTMTLTGGGVVVDTMTYGAALAAVDGVSMNRAVDGVGGAFVLHRTLSALACSPGLSVSGLP